MAKNAGPAAARNYGASQARGEVLFFVDSDIVIERLGWACDRGKQPTITRRVFHTYAGQRLVYVLMLGHQSPAMLIEVTLTRHLLVIDRGGMLTVRAKSSIRTATHLWLSPAQQGLISWQSTGPLLTSQSRMGSTRGRAASAMYGPTGAPPNLLESRALRRRRSLIGVTIRTRLKTARRRLSGRSSSQAGATHLAEKTTRYGATIHNLRLVSSGAFPRTCFRAAPRILGVICKFLYTTPERRGR